MKCFPEVSPVFAAQSRATLGLKFLLKVFFSEYPGRTSPKTLPKTSPQISPKTSPQTIAPANLQKCVGGFLLYKIWRIFLKNFPEGFFWALFPAKMRKETSGDKIHEKIWRPTIKIREKSVLPKTDPKNYAPPKRKLRPKLRSAETPCSLGGPS